MIICADDFGISLENDKLILDLIREKKISATSVIIIPALLDISIFETLKHYHDQLDIGLHFVLAKEKKFPAQYRRLSDKKEFLPFNQFILHSNFAFLHFHKHVAEELKAQLDLFEKVFGFVPDFIDSHLHIHQLPFINRVFLEVLEEISATSTKRFYVRHTATRFTNMFFDKNSILKNVVIGAVGYNFKKMLSKSNFYHNHYFFGVYNYNYWHRFKNYMQFFIKAAQHDNDIIMVHPGATELWRNKEYTVLKENINILPNRFNWNAV